MTFHDDILLRAAVFILASAGFLIARHIFKHKQSGQALVCPIQFDCHSVIHSDYSRFLGIRLEILGMVYYGLTALFYLLFIFVPNDLPNLLINAFGVAAIAAFIFSLYLIFIQIFVLKKGCSWCFLSAFICVLIFVFTMI